MARSGMSDLITRVRSLTNAGTALFSDDQVQDVLDRHRTDVVHEPLVPDDGWLDGGAVEWKVFRSRYGQYEATEGGTAVFVVTDGAGNARGTSGWTADYQRGVVTFTADQGGTALYLSGRTFDVHAAAAEVLEEWASKVALDFDFGTDGQTFRRSQKAEALREQAKLMRQRSRPRRVGIRTSGYAPHVSEDTPR